MGKWSRFAGAFAGGLSQGLEQRRQEEEQKRRQEEQANTQMQNELILMGMRSQKEEDDRLRLEKRNQMIGEIKTAQTLGDNGDFSGALKTIMNARAIYPNAPEIENAAQILQSQYDMSVADRAKDQVFLQNYTTEINNNNPQKARDVAVRAINELKIPDNVLVWNKRYSEADNLVERKRAESATAKEEAKAREESAKFSGLYQEKLQYLDFSKPDDYATAIGFLTQSNLLESNIGKAYLDRFNTANRIGKVDPNSLEAITASLEGGGSTQEVDRSPSASMKRFETRRTQEQNPPPPFYLRGTSGGTNETDFATGFMQQQGGTPAATTPKIVTTQEKTNIIPLSTTVTLPPGITQAEFDTAKAMTPGKTDQEIINFLIASKR